MKKIVLNIMLVIMSIGLFACGSKSSANVETKTENLETKKIKVVTTIYPEYDWVNNIISGKEDKFDVSILMTSGVDLHNFKPSAKDILDISTADLFIYVGGESDKWVDDAVRTASNKNLKTINLMEVLKDKVKVEEEIEGMEEEEHHHEEGEEHAEGEEEIEYDEHVWLSLNNAITICNEIEKNIVELDAQNASVYYSNLEKYLSVLRLLDEGYKSVVNSASRKVVLFGDRFPFRYMVDDYGIKYFAAFKGCSAETEASFETIKFLADKLGEEKLPYVLKIERSDDKIARAIIDNSTNKDAQVETMYSIQAVSNDDINAGETYYTYMQKNLEVLKKVLN